jgi:hypothetical protein
MFRGSSILCQWTLGLMLKKRRGLKVQRWIRNYKKSLTIIYLSYFLRTYPLNQYEMWNSSLNFTKNKWDCEHTKRLLRTLPLFSVLNICSFSSLFMYKVEIQLEHFIHPNRSAISSSQRLNYNKAYTKIIANFFSLLIGSSICHWLCQQSAEYN